ncbi:MAG: hypothetical protein COA79_03860 [Planctomycetota bacterium]|nr:MAG: hypothetical protein COA79_03860 [Planctomycetota bacterium]
MKLIAIYAIAKKELQSYFYSPIAYVVMTVFLIITGILFNTTLESFQSEFTPDHEPMEVIYGSSFWITQLILIPTITMRLFSEDKRTGYIEVLLSAPVKDYEVVLGKYFGASIYYIILWLPTWIYVYILFQLTTPDIGPILTGFLGVILIGLFFTSIGLLASALTKNQVISSVICFCIIAIIFSIGKLKEKVENETLSTIFQQVSLLDHSLDFSKGIIDTSYIIYYISVIVLSLFATVRILESRKWS